MLYVINIINEKISKKQKPFWLQLSQVADSLKVTVPYTGCVRKSAK
jgi:hypothetical protein